MAILRKSDFSGGMTDEYINGQLNCAQQMENFLLDKNKKPYCRYGSDFYLADTLTAFTAQLMYGAGRIDRLKYFSDILLRFRGRSVFDDDGDEILATNQLFGNTDIDYTAHISIEEWKDHLYCANDKIRIPAKIFENDSNEITIHTAGLPSISGTPAATGTAGASNFIYILCYENTYQTSGGVTHTEYGPVTWVYATGVNAPDVNPITLSGLQQLDSGITLNYPINSRIAVFRTLANGSIGYLSGYTSGTTFVDTSADATIDDNITIYTTGGVVDNDPLPACKYISQTDQVMWLLGVTEGSEFKPFRARQCKYGNPDAAPAIWFVDVDGDITGGKGIRSSQMVFEKYKTYRFDGYVDSVGNGSTKKTIVSHTIGCVSNNGIVPVDNGLIFPAVDGFYYTDGFTVRLISKHLSPRYAEITRTDAIAQQISGKRNPKDGRIYWTVQEGTETDENDAIWVLDPNFGLSDRSTFTSITGEDWEPTAIEFIDGDLIRADAAGVVFQHDENLYADKKLTTISGDVFTTATDVPIIYDYISCHNSYGDEAIRSYFTMFHLQAKSTTNQSISVQSINDVDDPAQLLKEIRYRGQYVWGDPESVWGEEEAVWNDKGMIVAKRRFPANKLRATYKAIRLTNSKTIYLRSDDTGGCVVNSTTKIATLLYGYTLTTEEGRQLNTEELQDIITESTLHDWSTDYVGDEYRISFSIDGYVNDYEIVSVADSELTFSDIHNDSVTSETDWIIRRYPRNERLHVDSYSIEYHKVSDSHDFFVTGGDGGNA